MQRLHPLISFIFFSFLLLMTVFFLQPVFLAISLFFSIWYCFILKGEKAFWFLSLALILMVLIAGLNPLLNHQGVTTITYLWNNPITWESIFYGITTALMTGNIVIWSICMQEVLTGDKLMALFGKPFPTLTLIFTMILATIPKLLLQNNKIKEAQKGMGQKPTLRNLLQRFSILLTWALENGLDTADSMTARGYGSKRRSHFSTYNFSHRDGFLALLGLLLITILIAGLFSGSHHIYFFPFLEFPTFSAIQLTYYGCYAVFCSIPVFLHYEEVSAWYRAKI